MSAIISVLLWFLAIGCGMIAGLYFAFSAFIMTALARSGTATAITAMNAINAVILKSAFMPLFYATSLGALLVALAAVLNWDGQVSPIILAGALVYFIGMTVVTIACNVPLNNELAATDPLSPQSAPVWSKYFARWTMWNHVRTVASTLASIAFVASLCMR
ncbi:anthrone oxygenase family protein [Hyphomicrobium sp.]|uniref:anthrone oxygenase family protein n=1 Tax=Hyphomicrobium sp. TaxID=82 RepID=UPI003F6FCC5D